MAVRALENDSEIQQLGSAIDDRVGVILIPASAGKPEHLT
jgi:hypothetical protein